MLIILISFELNCGFTSLSKIGEIGILFVWMLEGVLIALDWPPILSNSLHTHSFSENQRIL